MVVRSSSMNKLSTGSDGKITPNRKNNRTGGGGGQHGKSPPSPATDRPPTRSRSMSGLRGVSPNKFINSQTKSSPQRNRPQLIKSRNDSE